MTHQKWKTLHITKYLETNEPNKLCLWYLRNITTSFENFSFKERDWGQYDWGGEELNSYLQLKLGCQGTAPCQPVIKVSGCMFQGRGAVRPRVEDRPWSHHNTGDCEFVETNNNVTTSWVCSPGDWGHRKTLLKPWYRGGVIYIGEEEMPRNPALCF